MSDSPVVNRVRLPRLPVAVRLRGRGPRTVWRHLPALRSGVDRNRLRPVAADDRRAPHRGVPRRLPPPDIRRLGATVPGPEPNRARRARRPHRRGQHHHRVLLLQQHDKQAPGPDCDDRSHPAGAGRVSRGHLRARRRRSESHPAHQEAGGELETCRRQESIRLAGRFPPRGRTSNVGCRFVARWHRHDGCCPARRADHLQGRDGACRVRQPARLCQHLAGPACSAQRAWVTGARPRRSP